MGNRVDGNGKPVEDVLINPLALDRKAREAEANAKRQADDAAPWSRTKIERELERVAQEASFAIINGEEVRKSLDLHGADLSGLDLSELDLSQANLHGAKLIGTNLTGTILSGANMHGVDLSNSVLNDADLDKANLCEACLCDADASNASFNKANLADACIEGTKDLTNKEGANLTGISEVHVPFEEGGIADGK